MSIVSLHTKVFDFFPQESKFVWIDTIIKDFYIFFLLIKRELQYRKPTGGGTSEHQRKPEKGEVVPQSIRENQRKEREMTSHMVMLCMQVVLELLGHTMAIESWTLNNNKNNHFVYMCLALNVPSIKFTKT